MIAAEFVQLSLTPLIIGTLAAIASAVPGVFLLLRRQALIGDTISHAVLPGIVLAFLITGTTATWPMLIGAAGAAVVAALLIETIMRLGKVEPGAAMGVAFSALFASGLLLLEQSGASGVHLDVEHALYGNLESLIWLAADGWGALGDPSALAALPPELPRMAVVTTLILFLTIIFWRPLKLTSFDPTFARTLGLPVDAISLGLVIAAAIASVAAFDAVGSIIVIAMFICPPAAARLMTDRLGGIIWWSVGFATASAVLGYLLAGHGLLWLGGTYAVSAAGMIAVVSGVILGLACLLAPHRRRAQR